ncbi:MAG: MmcQ/YjbR family DNA-binding protein [Acidimicrobiales bacterium]
MRWRLVCKLASQLPEVEEGPTYGERALRVRGSIFARQLRDKRGVVVKVSLAEREVLCAAEPGVYSVPPEYRNYALMVVRLASVGGAAMRARLEAAWRLSAPPSLLADHDAGRTRPTGGRLNG